MEVLCSRYLIQTYHLPLVSREPKQFPSYGLGSAKPQAFHPEVDKMLEKGALEVAMFWFWSTSCLFLVEDGGQLIISLFSVTT